MLISLHVLFQNLVQSRTFLDLQLLQVSRRYVGPARSTENELSVQRKVANIFRHGRSIKIKSQRIDRVEITQFHAGLGFILEVRRSTGGQKAGLTIPSSALRYVI